jgi:hypothetical protein
MALLTELAPGPLSHRKQRSIQDRHCRGTPLRYHSGALAMRWQYAGRPQWPRHAKESGECGVSGRRCREEADCGRQNEENRGQKDRERGFGKLHGLNGVHKLHRSAKEGETGKPRKLKKRSGRGRRTGSELAGGSVGRTNELVGLEEQDGADGRLIEPAGAAGA